MSIAVYVELSIYTTHGNKSTIRLESLILLLFISRKPAIQGVCHIGVFKILYIAGFFSIIKLLRYSQLKGQFEYPTRKNKIVL